MKITSYIKLAPFLGILTVSMPAATDTTFSAVSQASPVAMRNGESTIVQRIVVRPDNDSGSGGMILLWKKPDGKWVQLTQSLDGINELLAEAAPTSASEKDRISTIQNVLVEYSRHLHTVLLVSTERDAYIRQLETKVSKDAATKVSSLAPDIATKQADGKWEISFCVATYDGSIQRYTFTGNWSPLSVTKQDIEIMVPSGTIAKFAYIPGY